jgi:hypothetical protein
MVRCECCKNNNGVYTTKGNVLTAAYVICKCAFGLFNKMPLEKVFKKSGEKKSFFFSTLSPSRIANSE